MTTAAAGLTDEQCDAISADMSLTNPITRNAEYRALIRAGYAAGAAAASVAREPTQSMIYAVQGMWGRVERGTIADVWRAMYDAAPAVAQGEKP